MEPFRNEPVLELRRAPVRAQLAQALEALDAELPLSVAVRIGDSAREGDDLISTDPGSPDRVVARAAVATMDEVDAALAAAQAAAPAWRDRPAAERAEILIRAAAILRADRLRIAALCVRETAKPWPEADADVCEAIDFLEYYARGAIELERGGGLVQVPGERNDIRWAGRGIVAVISPWNFPVAIPCGMVAAGLATGNAVVLKPAEQAPGCAEVLIEALREAGVPAGALSLLPGEGEVGAALVKDPRVHTIAFTGSGAVGLEIVRTAAEVQPGQKHLKRVIAEMGGKNVVMVDADADLDEVVPALVKSAFAYAGQKCSAAARAMVHEAVHDDLLERLAGAVEVLEVGQASDLQTDVGPVIERDALDRLRRYAESAERDGRIVARAASVPDSGWFAVPTVAADLPADSEVLNDEIFGPLLAVEKVASMEEACDRIDASPFALTGGLFARNPDTVDYVVGRSPVGNLYVNREITGAMVGRQPFGGNRLSGTGTKAGGPGYLLQFVEPYVVTENTVRHGLVV
ncbi:MAG: Proline dehydrogenase / Delta-1-pyrroline-5-carboxylate dehydrogenase [uncultured Solirubrobacteraceae bacterium]|uniref:L-glutamate gamma-semialdehyde dehydrogenase n=1 Tax=uncultured Solirubrobacteraceae bacterium TaxID=1162706 RepID=A0A6J4RIX5_9ACTN|nr:MAG: Proline dehydrogenase / Delta-1-pyrroline-5-carboxylate dehydrogenase [uncultured Solirubrobacteraceae bacterium]